MLDKAIDEKGFAFRMFLVVACWVVGTVWMVGSYFVKELPFFLGIAVIMTGTAVLLVELFYS